MRAVVVGANWGLVHVYALRQAGVEVVALGGRDRSQLANVATLHGIAHIVDSAAEIRALAPDLVTLATPAATVPTPTSETSLTEMSEVGLTFFRS